MSAMKTLPSRRGQRGFNLVELMIAMALGALVIAAAISLFTTNQRTFQLQQAITQSQEQGRFALDYLMRDLRQMGLVELDAATGLPVGTAGLLIANTSVTSKNAAAVMMPASAEGGAGATDNDRVTFSYYGYTDCEGDLTGLPDRMLIANTYWVDNDGSLFCMGSVDEGTGGVELVAGIDSFQVLYGVDENSDGIAFATRYVRANQVVNPRLVVSIKLGLLIRADGDRAVVGASEDFVVLDKQLASGAAPLEESRIRRLFTSTMKVRNYDWESI